MAEMVLGALLLLVVYRAKGLSLRLGKVKKSRCLGLLRDSWPAAISTVSVALLLKTDIVMLGEMVGNEAVGIYSVATTISIFWHFLPIIIVSSVCPFIIQAKADNEAIYIQRITQLFSLMTALALPIIVVIMVSSDALISFLYGNLYAAAGPVLAIHIIGCWVVFLAHAQEPWDIAENMLRFNMFKSVSAVFINIGLNLVLIPRYQTIGAATASVVALVISGVLLNLVSEKARPIFFIQIKSLLIYRYFNDK
jgi:PST family polysaccharide transporter